MFHGHFSMVFRRELCLTLQLPWVTKTEFLLTISIQYQPDKWRELRSILIWRWLGDSILNSLNQHYKNYMVDRKENYKFDLGVKGLGKLLSFKEGDCAQKVQGWKAEGGGLLPLNRLIGICHWMGSTFYDLIN